MDFTPINIVVKLKPNRYGLFLNSCLKNWIELHYMV